MTERGDTTYDADIRWTTHGVAHIRAGSWGSLGYGQGYACARDHLPTIADQLAKVRSERARHHGPGANGAILATDLGYLALGVTERAAPLRDAQPPELRALVTGYVAGLNRWAREAKGTDALPAWCRDAPWIREVDELDLYAYFVDMAMMASGRNLAEIIGRAEAPGPDGPAEPSPIAALGGDDLASNGWAFGGDATASGHGMVIANPHFPWGGEARFWECHLTIPGELDVYGVSLLGTPGVQLGFNEHVAWTHTFSKGHRFTIAKLDLAEGRPTAYRYGDEVREMTSQVHAVDVLGADGSVERVERTLWRSHHGPMINLPLVGWGLETAFTYRDANIDNRAMLPQFVAMDTARSLEEMQASYDRIQGMPWVNTLAADRTGRAWFIDASTTPALSPEAAARFVDRVQHDLIAALLHENRVALLDGSDPGDEWIEVDGAREPGVLPVSAMPRMERRDYVLNANDSHWLNHATATLEGYSPLHGLERTPRSLRTRQNLRVVNALARTGEVTIDAAVHALLDNRSLSAELLRDAVVARGRAAGGEAARAADVLAAWDGCFELSSVGAPLWREFVACFDAKAQRDAGPLFATAFDPDDPVATPHGLAPAPDAGPDPIVVALELAVALLDEAGVALDAPLGDVQWAQRGDRRVAVHGGCEGDGLCNVLAPSGALASQAIEPGPARLAPVGDRAATSGLAAGGYRCTYGTSFLMAVELTDDGPVASGLLAYGQSGDARSAHHADGTDAYAAKALRPLRFRDDDIEADPHLERLALRGEAPLSPG
ncbi:MAG: penicillin acylase family protein [Acidimicrobiales bacterium]|nr:penicillin acylase family protein [Acidimicrobiales bacterium]HRW39030.1 penicillin acylase family protein [Aquihabitans sp.]